MEQQSRSEIISNIAINSSKSSERYFIKNYINLYNEIIDFSIDITDITFKEKIWFWVNNITKRPKCLCGNYTKFNGSWKNGIYLRNCSVKCSSTDIIRIKNMKNNALDKYGVDSYTKTDEYKEKKKNILLCKYGVDHYSKTDEYKLKIKKTNIERYGVEHYSKTEEFQDRIKKSCIKKYGVDNVFKSEIIKNKIKDILLEKYNVDNYVKTEQYILKTNETNLIKYGVKTYMQSSDFKEKSKKTNIEKYGVDHYSKTNEYKEKVINTSLERYGESNYTKTDECKEKVINTSLERYSKSNYTKTDECKNKIKKTNLERYGVESVLQSCYIKEKIKKTNLEKYSVDHYSKTDISRSSYDIFNDIKYIKYIGNTVSLLSCEKGHEYEINSDNYRSRIRYNSPMCTVCYPINDFKSGKENELLEYIKSIYSGEIISGYRDQLEIDIYLPEFKLGFEFNGLYWHSSKFKEKNYHLNKSNFFKEKDIRIIHIWEDDYDLKLGIIKSQIKNLLGLSKKIFARKCIVKEVNIKESKQFLDNNHIQGFVASKIKLGLYYNEELVSLMTFDNNEGRKKMEDGYNINRFCNKIENNISGGASKLLSYFIKKYDVKRIISYADKDWSVGQLYEIIGFENISDSGPDYKYIVDNKRVHKSRYKKDKLNLEDKTKTTESQEMIKRGIYRIYDCGKLKFEKKL